MTDRTDLAGRFEQQRPRLRAIAAQLLGSTADADDAVQETWLRLERVDDTGIRNLDAWLTTVVSRVSLDLLRAPRRTRESSWQVSPWRDEPVAVTPDPAEVVADADGVSVALLVVLERLSPAERIAFVLHDVFGQPFEQIAAVLDRSPDAARQLASRGRRRVRGGPASSLGSAPSSTASPTDRATSRRIVDAWLLAAEGGDFRALLSLLDDDAVLHADFGASSQVIEGAASIASQAVLSARLAAHSMPVLIGGLPGVAAVLNDQVVSIMAFDIRGDRIVGLRVLADPRRLESLGVRDALD
ncbi:sigma-70 family RNA polymerase sigma factor [Herbiconiux sp. CPCC 205763]|uniref:Sigma-70 family RNA polymerase sigma factor n=1 Tax=Herbiconiux aconitum TaxID=2970913 RepID=A0ABT2GPI1_9MICO|nr:sigma-70 family RNA polymerase sigma factor [Herbiconiux aconitum]MCS5718026.1 sigma-70 family RNA polymerase sigma factor [Herbiconiux aconitum]